MKYIRLIALFLIVVIGSILYLFQYNITLDSRNESNLTKLISAKKSDEFIYGEIEDIGIGISIPSDYLIIEEPIYEGKTGELDTLTFKIEPIDEKDTTSVKLYGVYKLVSDKVDNIDFGLISKSEEYIDTENYNVGDIEGFTGYFSGDNKKRFYNFLINDKILYLSTTQLDIGQRDKVEKVINTIRLN